MIESIVLVRGTQEARDKVGHKSLANAKQLVYGRFGKDGTILHVAATADTDLQKVIFDFAHVPGITGVLTLAVSQ